MQLFYARFAPVFLFYYFLPHIKAFAHYLGQHTVTELLLCEQSFHPRKDEIIRYGFRAVLCKRLGPELYFERAYFLLKLQVLQYRAVTHVVRTDHARIQTGKIEHQYRVFVVPTAGLRHEGLGLERSHFCYFKRSWRRPDNVSLFSGFREQKRLDSELGAPHNRLAKRNSEKL